MGKYLGATGLAYLWGKIKTVFATKEEVGDTNVIETVKVNNTALTPDESKAVNISVPTALSSLSDDSTHRLVTDAEKTTWNNKLSTAPVISVNGQTGAVTTATVVKYVQETGSDYWEYSSENTLTAAEAYNRLISDPYNCYLHLKRYYEIGEGLEDSEEYLMYFQSMVYSDSTGLFEAYFVSDYNESYENIGYATLEGNSQSYNISSFAKKTIPTVNNSTVTVTMNGGTVGTFTLNKSTSTTINLGTVLTSHQTLKTINGNSIVGTGDLAVSGLPSVTSSDNNKILQVVSGAWATVAPINIYNGSTVPSSSLGSNGDIYIQTS